MEKTRLVKYVVAARSSDARIAVHAQNALWAEYHLPLQRFLRARGCGREDAEDLVVDAFMAAIRGLSSCNAQQFAGWLWTIGKNGHTDSHRSTGRRTRTISLDSLHPAQDVPSNTPRPDEQYESRLLQEQLARALMRLSDRDRELLRIRYVEGLTCEQAGERLSKVKSTVSYRMARIRSKLRSAMARLPDDSDEPGMATCFLSEPTAAFACAAAEGIVGGRLSTSLPIPDAEDCADLRSRLRGDYASLRDLVVNSDPRVILDAPWLLRFLGIEALYPDDMPRELQDIFAFMNENFGTMAMPEDFQLQLDLSFFSTDDSPAIAECVRSDPGDWTNRMAPVTRTFAHFSGLPAPTETDPHGAVELYSRWTRVVRHGRPIQAALVALHLLLIARRVSAHPVHDELRGLFASDAPVFFDRIQSVSNDATAQRWADFSRLSGRTRCQIRT